MAKIIEFYVPQDFQKDARSVPELEPGKVIEFPLDVPRSAEQDFAAIEEHDQLRDSRAQFGISAAIDATG